MSERMISVEASERSLRIHPAAHMAARAVSLRRRVVARDFGTAERPQQHRILIHPVLKPSEQEPYKARLPKKMILPGLDKD